MNKKMRVVIPASIIVVAALSSTLCHSETPSDRTTSAKQIEEPQYTFIKDCKDKINNDNAAFTELSCFPLGKYKVDITAQSPQFYNIHLTKGAEKISTDFTVVTNDNPVEAGKAIEWHLHNNEPKYMIFRLSWGTDAEPFKMKQHLVLNLITSKEICSLATVDVKKNKNANQKVRELMLNKFSKITDCPAEIARY